MDSKQVKKEVKQLEKKLRPGLSVGQLLQEDTNFVELFRSNNAQLHAILKFKDFREMVQYVTVVGPEDDKMRSYRYPFVASEILSSESPRIFDVFMTQVSDEPSAPILLAEMLKYFDGQPNFVLSGYQIKILLVLYFHEPLRIQNIIIETGTHLKMLRFLSSQSVAQFLLKLIVVQNQVLLNMHFKERKEIYERIIAIYEANSEPQEILHTVHYMLTEAILRLWSQKHKELGRFSESMIKFVEVVVEKNNLYEQQSIVYLIMKHLTLYLEDAPLLIKMLLKKIYKQLSAITPEQIKTSFKETIPRFGIRNLRMLQALSISFSSCQAILQSLIPTMNLFGMLLSIFTKFEWNNAIHVEVEKIFKDAFKSKSNQIFRAIFKKGNFVEVSKEIIRKDQTGKQNKGYMGCFINILLAANEAAKKDTEFGQYLNKEEARFVEMADRYLAPKAHLYVFDLGGYKTVHSFARACYDTNQILDKHKDFLQAQIMPEELMKHDSGIIQQEVLSEMEDENMVTRNWGLKQEDPAKEACLDK